MRVGVTPRSGERGYGQERRAAAEWRNFCFSGDHTLIGSLRTVLRWNPT